MRFVTDTVYTRASDRAGFPKANMSCNRRYGSHFEFSLLMEYLGSKLACIFVIFVSE